MQTAEKLKEYAPGRFRAGFASIKHNGIHGTFDNKEGIIYSRTPRIIKGLDHIIEALKPLPFKVQGELIVPGLHFQDASGLIRSRNPVPEAKFMVFNLLDDRRVHFISRNSFMRDVLSVFTGPIQLVDFIAVNTVKEYDWFHEKVIANGHEGTCWIAANHVNQPGKITWDWMKRVPYKEMEVRVMEVCPGTKGKKYEDSLGHFNCEFTNDKSELKKVKVGIFIGQTDEWRKKVAAKPEDYLYQPITIVYKDLSKDGIPVQPRYKAVRWDLVCN